MFFTPNLVIGLTIMSVGAVLLLDTLGIRDAAQMIRYWPALIVLFGASIVAQAFRPADPGGAAGHETRQRRPLLLSFPPRRRDVRLVRIP
jgi:hypothetical protein